MARCIRLKADRYPATQSLERVYAIVGFAVIALLDLRSGRHAGNAGADQAARQCRCPFRLTDKRAALQHVPPWQQGFSEHRFGYWA